MENPQRAIGQRPKSNQLGLILSGLVPGLGQFYNEDWAKGCAFFFGILALGNILLPEGYLDILRGEIPLSMGLLGRLTLLGVAQLWCVYDADQSIKKKNADAARDCSK